MYMDNLKGEILKSNQSQFKLNKLTIGESISLENKIKGWKQTGLTGRKGPVILQTKKVELVFG